MVAPVTQSRRFGVRLANFVYPQVHKRGELLTLALFELPLREAELSLCLLQVPFMSGDLARACNSGKQHCLLIHMHTYY